MFRLLGVGKRRVASNAHYEEELVMQVLFHCRAARLFLVFQRNATLIPGPCGANSFLL